MYGWMSVYMCMYRYIDKRADKFTAITTGIHTQIFIQTITDIKAMVIKTPPCPSEDPLLDEGAADPAQTLPTSDDHNGNPRSRILTFTATLANCRC